MYPVHRMKSGPWYSRLIARNNAETNAALRETAVAKNVRNFWRMAPYNRPRTSSVSSAAVLNPTFPFLFFFPPPSLQASASPPFYDNPMNFKHAKREKNTDH